MGAWRRCPRGERDAETPSGLGGQGGGQGKTRAQPRLRLRALGERERSSGHPSRESSPPEALTRPQGAVLGDTETAFSGGHDAASQQRRPTRPESKGVEFDGIHILILFTEMDLQAAQ